MLTFGYVNPLAKLTFLLVDCLLILNQVRISGGHGYFQSDEDELVSELRAMVHDFAHKDYMTSKGYLLRWLRVHDFDLDETLEKFKQSMQWRKDNDIDHIFKENFSSVDELYPFAVEGVDKDGRPIVWAPVGAYDVRKIVIAGEQQMYQRYMMRMFELMEVRLHQLRQTSGRDNITQAVMLFDLGGFNVKTGACLRCLGMIPEFMNNVERNYPNIFYKAYHVNTPGLFESVFRVAKNLMSAQTKEALQIYDYNKDKWTAALLQQIPADQLPVQYGGTKPIDYYTIAANRNHLISSIIAYAETDSHLASEGPKPRPQQSNHQKHREKSTDTELTINSISRRHMEEADPLESIVETISSKDAVPNLLSSSSSALVASSSLSQRAIPDTMSTTSSTELPHAVRHHKHHHHHHYQDVSTEIERESYKSEGLYLRSGARSNLIPRFNVFLFTKYTLTVFSVFCLSRS